MNARADGRGNELGAGEPVRVGGCVGGGAGRVLSAEADIRPFDIHDTLLSVEEALILLDSHPPKAIEAAALERIRDDLVLLLSNLQAEARR